MSHQFTLREVALLMAREIDHQESAPEDDEYIGDWAPTHSCGGAGDPTCAACWMHSYDRAAGAVAEEPEWEYGWEADEDVRTTSRPRGPRILFDGVPYPPEEMAAFARGRRIRRRKAGPWVPVKQEGAESDV
ncbi:hypothetical protein ABS642_00865 [Microbacterium sp. A8/3-1]|uniref:Uncharacterized protein n=1 Tax=Microbacterium sp. A8/3-1 TaxID=3160749 RepID=A0AAU7VY54_9MICO